MTCRPSPNARAQRSLLPLALLAVAGGALAGPYDPSFTVIPPLPGGGFAIGYAVSADGSTVVGLANSPGGTQAFRYDRATGAMAGLGDLPGGEFSSQAVGVSGDGRVVVGSGTGASGREAFWSRKGAMVGLGDLPGGGFSSEARGVSGDGTVVVGTGTVGATAFNTGGARAFRYANGVFAALPLVPGTARSWANAISLDGTTIVGQSGYQAFRHTIARGTAGLGLLPGASSTEACGVSGDGTVVVGVANYGKRHQAFRYTPSGGMVGLGTLPGDTESFAAAVTADGRVTVGTSIESYRAYIHDPVNGMRDLTALLSARGVLPAGWQIYTALGVGMTPFGVPVVTGLAASHYGTVEAFVAEVPLSAAPLTLSLRGAEGRLRDLDSLAPFAGARTVDLTALLAHRGGPPKGWTQGFSASVR